MKFPTIPFMMILLTGSGAVQAATIVDGDPSPNNYDPVTFDPIDGGIGYHWTITMSGNDTAAVQRHVGAWSWDEDGQPATERGWTHTSNWVALTLTAPSRLNLRLERQAGVPDPTPQDPLAVAGANLYPGFTIYSGWDADGPDFHTYNNRGNVAWAEDVTYLDHIENNGTASFAERSWSLAAGTYSLALGGNSPSLNAEGRQGYLATLTTTPVPEPAVAFFIVSAAGGAMARRRRV